MAGFQIWLDRTLKDVNPVNTFMHTAWGWPVAESVHFLGLSLLVGAIALFDLRLLGMAKRIPIAALHRLIPWGLTGPDQMLAGAVARGDPFWRSVPLQDGRDFFLGERSAPLGLLRLDL